MTCQYPTLHLAWRSTVSCHSTMGLLMFIYCLFNRHLLKWSSCLLTAKFPFWKKILISNFEWLIDFGCIIFLSNKVISILMTIIKLPFTDKSELLLDQTLYLCTWILYIFLEEFLGVVTFHQDKVTCSEHNSDCHMQRIMVAFFLILLDALAIDPF